MTKVDRTQRVIEFPVSNSAWVEMKLPTPMTEAEWDLLLTILAAMRPGLVAPPAPAHP